MSYFREDYGEFMQRFDRILGILLFLRSKKSVSASELAKHFEVSPRTIYRDLETLSAQGVPLYAERGRDGGFRLLEGYFLPPLMFTQQEAVALLSGLTLQRNLRATLFKREVAIAEQKLLAALPNKLRSTLEKAEKLIGFEQLPNDIFHPEPVTQGPPAPMTPGKASLKSSEVDESDVISIFFQAILDGNLVRLHYRSPYRTRASESQIEPLGLFWDRDHWYLVGCWEDQEQSYRLWRADRVIDIELCQAQGKAQKTFDVRELLGHNWLRPAMEQWRDHVPVKIRLTTSQAQRLKQDWYYHHALFEPLADDQVVMTFGECDLSLVLELLRWLGLGAELLEPYAWREQIRTQLQQMLDTYASPLSL